MRADYNPGRMKRPLIATLLLCAGWAGCAESPRDPFAAMAASASAARERLAPALGWAEVQRLEKNWRGDVETGSAACGIVVLDRSGTAILPMPLERDQVQRIRVWLGGREHAAVFLKSDPRLGMSLVRVAASGGPFRPVPPGAAAVPAPGSWAVCLTPTGRDADFQVFAAWAPVAGTVLQEFDRVVLAAGLRSGAIAADASGGIFGMACDSGILSFADVRRRLERLLARPDDDAEEASSDDPEDGKPWIGVTLLPANEDWAEASGMPKEAVWIQGVCRGSPAEKAGLRAGDLIVRVDGRPLPIGGPRALEGLMKLLAPEQDREASVEVLRADGRASASVRFVKRTRPRELKAEDLGLLVREIDDVAYFGTETLYRREGILVAEVVEGSPAGTSNAFGVPLIRPNDVVLALDGVATPDLDAFAAALDAVRRRHATQVLVRLQRGVSATHAALNLSLKRSQTEGE